MKLTVVLMLWEGWRPIYEPLHVNALVSMLQNYIRIPFETVLLTDQPGDYHTDRVLPLPADPENLGFVSGANCFRRLRLYDQAYTDQFAGEWIMSIDLDTLILEDITDVVEWATVQSFGACLLEGKQTSAVDDWRDKRPYNGALQFIQPGRHQDVWDSFNGIYSRQRMATTGWIGSDQVWLSLVMPGAPTIGQAQGAYFLGDYQEAWRDIHGARTRDMPRLINYAGFAKPWSKTSYKDNPELFNAWRDHATAHPWQKATAN